MKVATRVYNVNVSIIFIIVGVDMSTSLTFIREHHSLYQNITHLTMPRISATVRATIIKIYCTEKDILLREIAKWSNVSKDSPRKVITKFREHNTLGDRPGRKRKRGCINPILDKKIVAAFRKNWYNQRLELRRAMYYSASCTTLSQAHMVSNILG